jgi:hypothetical protein
MSNPKNFPKIDKPKKMGPNIAPMPAALIEMAAEMKATK